MAVLLGLQLAACDAASILTKQGPQDGGRLTEAIVGEASTLNPLFAADDNVRDVDALVYQGLTSVNSNQDVVPQLARALTASEDRRTYVAKLRPGTRWADGEPLTIDDVLFTYGLLRDPAYTDPGAQFWKEVRVEQNGVDEVRFVLKAPDAAFPGALRQAILPKHVFGSVAIGAMAGDDRSMARAFGTGPYMVESISANHKVVTLKRNPNASPRPHIDRFVFHSYPTLADAVDAVTRGEADAVGALQPPQLGMLSRRTDLSVHELKTFNFAAVLLNLGPDLSAYFNPPAVRQAMNQAIDRAAIVRGVLDGHADPAPGPIPPTDWAFDRTAASKLPYDPRAAAATLTAAGWVLPAAGTVRQRNGKDFSVSLVTADAYPYRQVAEAISQQLARVGIQVTIDAVPASVLVSRYLVGKHFQMALVAFDNGPDPDQFGLWHSSNSQAVLNFASVLTPKQALIDKDLEDGRSASDRKARRAAYADFQDLMADAAPAIFLYEPHYAYITGIAVHGVRTNPVVEPVDRFQHVAQWWVDVKRS